VVEVVVVEVVVLVVPVVGAGETVGVATPVTDVLGSTVVAVPGAPGDVVHAARANAARTATQAGPRPRRAVRPARSASATG
jgi:hypothetical protein